MAEDSRNILLYLLIDVLVKCLNIEILFNREKRETRNEKIINIETDYIYRDDN